MSVYLSKMEEAIGNIQAKNNVPHHLSIVRKMLNAEFKCNCVELNLVENSTQGYFFGAHVFPTETELYKIADNIIRIDQNIKFEKCSEFVIELDSKLIYDIGATPGEIMAVILHEVGHKAFHTNAQIRSKALFSISVLKFLPTAGLVFKLFSPIKFILFTFILAGFESSFAGYNMLKTEIEADKFAIANGYAVELNSILNKLTNDSVRSAKIASRGGATQQERVIMNWTLANALQFSIRRIALINDLKEQLKGEDSPQLRKVIEGQIAAIKTTQGSFSIKAIKNEDKEKAINESMKTFFEMHKKGYSRLEIDELEVEIDRIESHEDKLYVLNRIHSNMKKADKAMKSGKAYGTPNDYKEFKGEMNRLLKKTKDVKVTIPDYSQNVINITYPKGYEG